LKLLIASCSDEIKDTILGQLAVVGINEDQLTFVQTAKEFVDALITDAHQFIVADFEIEDANIWQLAKLMISEPIAVHALPIFLLEETCDLEIPALLAREHFFKVVSLNALGLDIMTAYEINCSNGYERGYAHPNKHKLLIVEDDQDAAFSAYHALKDSYEIDIAEDGLSGYGLWEKKRHDLVLLDLMLPVLKGDAVLNKIMAIDQHQPVIIITGHDKTFNSNDLLLNGASEYLNKPFSMATLKDRCQAILMRAKLNYQSHHTNTKLKAVKKLVWALESALCQKNLVKAQRIIATIKTVLPGEPYDDESVTVIGSEFLP
jgi:CheY-like chemotaxis protein